MLQTIQSRTDFHFRYVTLHNRKEIFVVLDISVFTLCVALRSIYR